MRMNEIAFTDAQPVDGYGPGFFRVAGQAHPGPLLLTPGGRMNWGGFDDLDTLTGLTGQIDVLFLGTGAETAHVPGGLRQSLESVGIGVEAMNSPSACRTYNVLLSEGRRVALAALPV
ncbi:Mth938-like domain-containing protein [Thalassococcus sp. CAU 1522]|uniref:Mth938-like domain-containing protein n=1 Tax=Thalassococcus arenae TaxID=2851652 RepID=A0ABS6NB91_9RHOB|nr:Mth938-like domain-containing protein [Thalassococcus arenae]MBV2361268.1 Mth938-like domain-containing protein [Thalassococcus arenae]